MAQQHAVVSQRFCLKSIQSVCLDDVLKAETYFEGQTWKIVHILSFCNVKQSSFRSLVMDFCHEWKCDLCSFKAIFN